MLQIVFVAVARNLQTMQIYSVPSNVFKVGGRERIHQRAFTKTGPPDRIGSDRIDKICTRSDRINKTWIELRPIDKTRTGSEKNRIGINFPPK